MLIVACKFVTKSQYIENTETKQKLRPMAHDMDQFLSPFAIKNGVLYAPFVSREVILVVEMHSF